MRRAARSEAILEVPRLLEIARELRLSRARSQGRRAEPLLGAPALARRRGHPPRAGAQRGDLGAVGDVCEAAQRAPNGPLRLARPLLDRPAAGQPACGGTLTTDDAKRFAVLGPSVRCLKSPALQAQLAPWRKAPRGLVVWVVDTLDDAVAVARAGATNVVSNVPPSCAPTSRGAAKPTPCRFRPRSAGWPSDRKGAARRSSSKGRGKRSPAGPARAASARRRPASPGTAASTASNGQVCLFLARWGKWPAWISVLVRTLELNVATRFLLLGDELPEVFKWPSNCAFHRLSLEAVTRRVRETLGGAPAAGLATAGGSSKVSDFKPMFGALFPELLDGCGYWGYMQEDQFLGNLGAYLDAPLLAAHDTFSPLNPPFYNAGPFMVYRNAPAVNALYRKSARWQQVAASGEYMAFDEWWGRS